MILKVSYYVVVEYSGRRQKEMMNKKKRRQKGSSSFIDRCHDICSTQLVVRSFVPAIILLECSPVTKERNGFFCYAQEC